MLVPHGSGRRDAGHVVETPDAHNLQAGTGNVREDLVDVLILGQESAPVAVGPGVVLRLAIDVEQETVRLGEAPSR